MKLKNWDIEAFKAGAKPCYANGDPCDVHIWSNGLIESMDDNWFKYTHFSNGKCIIDPFLGCHIAECDRDLKLMPNIKTGWVNIYKDEFTPRPVTGTVIFDSTEVAKNKDWIGRIATIPIEWEEEEEEE